MLKAAGARLKWSALLTGLCWWLAICLGLWLALFLFDNLLSLPAGLRLPLGIGGAVLSGAHLFGKVLRPAWRKQTLEQTALMLEKRFGIQENLLINAVQFQRQNLHAKERVFAEQTIAVSTQYTEGIRTGDLWDWRKMRLWGGAATAVLLLWTGFVILFPRQFIAAASRYAMPLGDSPPAGRLALNLTPAGDVTVAEGESLDVSLAVLAPSANGLPKPPIVVWMEREDFIPPVASSGEVLVMTERKPTSAEASSFAEASADRMAGLRPLEALREDREATDAEVPNPANRSFVLTFANIQSPFAFRAFVGDNYTRSIQVKVRPTPRLKESVFRVTPPAYTGQKTSEISGPPSPLAALPGSVAETSFKVEPGIASATWKENGVSSELKYAGGRWQSATTISNSGAYEIEARFGAAEKPVALARGEIQLLTDHPPEVEFVTEDRNRLVQFGQTLKLDIEARDDFGLANIEVVARAVDRSDDTGALIKRWTYLGPPGNPGPARETFSFTVDPRAFQSGASYYLEALANDFRPGGIPSRSRPILLRVRAQEDMTLGDSDPLGSGFEELKKAIASQEKANGLTSNFRTYLEEITRERRVAEQANAMSDAENEARAHARQAAVMFDQQADGKPYAAPLNNLCFKDMASLQTDLRNLPSARDETPKAVEDLQRREEQILDRLRLLLGELADKRGALKPASEGKDAPQAPLVTKEEQERELAEDVKTFLAEEERILERSRTLADKGPEDLTQGKDDPQGEMARDEEKWAKFFEEKMTDFGKLPQQDFADATLAQELNSVYQEVKLAAEALTQKKMELAVPAEQGGIENARELENNLERWLPDAPDNIKWSMEEPNAPLDIALAELPKELEDIVGELIDKEEAMTPDVQDVTSSWMDSADKGAGWGASDGPISDMSAKGVTGNLLPNQNEVGGRSGEGRNGRSHGQMVSDTAEGKGGQETPTRLKPEPFESGSVKDSAKNDQGGATGGGKLSGAAGEGLRGPSPASSGDKMPRLADQQAKIRQQAEALALNLRRYHIPSGELENSVNAMTALEIAARKNDGLGVRRAFVQAANSLDRAKQTVDDQITVRREQDKLPTWMRDEIRSGVQDGIPKGYEEMVGEYFRALAEGRKQ